MSSNDYICGLLKDVYAGKNGATTLFLQFTYFQYILSNFENEFKQVFCSIASRDLQHHKMLGELIVKFGGDPDFCTANEYFSGKFIENFKGIKQILSYAVELKEKSIINYKIILSKIEEKQALKVLKSIVVDEQKDKEVLQDLLKKYNSEII